MVKIISNFFMLFVLFMVVFSPEICSSEMIDVNPITGIINLFSEKSIEIGTKLTGVAEYLLKLCMIINISLLGIGIALKRSDICETFYLLIMTILFTGFILAVIRHYGEWSNQIINGFLNLGSMIGGSELNLSPLNIGLSLAADVWRKTNITEPVDSLGYVILGGGIIVCFALMTAKIIYVQCESYLVLNASIVLLGFGGLTHTKNYALNAMRYCLSVAFKLFVMQLLIGVGMTMFKRLVAANNGNLSLEALGVYIFAAIILVALTHSIPEAAAGIINGSHVGGGHNVISGAAAVGGAVGGAIGGAVGAGMATGRGLSSIKAAFDVAGPGGQGKTGWARGAQAAKNISDSFSTARRQENAYGSTGQRMNSILKDQRDVSRAQATPPQQPHPPQDSQD